MLDRFARTLGVWVCLCGAALAANPPGVWLDIPFVKQQKDGCGAASIAMIMQYWAQHEGRDPQAVDAAAIQRVLYSAEGHGIYASDLERYFQQHAFRTFAFKGEYSDLRQHLEKGRPLLVALKPSGGNAPLHYVVVTGLNWEDGLVMINDPAQRKLLKVERASFEREWSAAGKWTLLALPLPDAR